VLMPKTIVTHVWRNSYRSEAIGKVTIAQARQLLMEWREKLRGRKFADSVELIPEDGTR
jgi:hypothetical protein